MAAGIGLGWQQQGWGVAAPQPMWAPQVAAAGNPGFACMVPQWQMQAMPMQMMAAPQYAAVQPVGWNGSGSWGGSHDASGAPALDRDVVAAFANELGVDPDDTLFGWMAELALQSPLPQRWTCNRDPNTGCIYYTDSESQTSSWENPLIPYLRRVVDVGRGYVQNPAPSYMETEKASLWQEFKEDLDGWHGPFSDPSGRTYYVNHRTNSASSADPRVDSQYIYELQCSFLDTFLEVVETKQQNEETPGTPGSHWGSGENFFNASDVGSPGGGGGTGGNLGSSQGRSLRLLLQKNAQAVDHKSTLESMTDRAKLFRAMRGHEDEVQRLTLAKKAEMRRQRRMKAAEAARGLQSPSSCSNDGNLSPNSLRQKRQLQPLQLGLGGDSAALGGGWQAPAELPPVSAPNGPAPAGLQPPEIMQVGGGGLPPVGMPSPANRLPPTKFGAKGGLLTPLHDPPLPRATSSDVPQPAIPIPASPSLNKAMGGKDTAAISFLTKSLAAHAAAKAEGRMGSKECVPSLPVLQENGGASIDLEATLLQ